MNCFRFPSLFFSSLPRLTVPSGRDIAALLALAGLMTAPAWADKADHDMPMHAEADNLRYDDARQLSVFTGRVLITKGTIVIRGDRVEVRQDPQGNQFGVVTGSEGKLAFFRQKREGLDEFIEGEAVRIDYNGQADVVRFEQRAVMRRYRGTALADETMGSVIVYDNASETFRVEGGDASRTAANPSGRVRAVLTPAPKDGAKDLPPAEPAKLKSSGRLGGADR